MDDWILKILDGKKFIVLLLTRDDKLDFDYRGEIVSVAQTLRKHFPGKLLVAKMHPKQSSDQELIGFVESLVDHVLHSTRTSNEFVFSKADLVVMSYSTSFYEVLQTGTTIVTYGNPGNPVLRTANFSEENPAAHASDLKALDALMERMRDPVQLDCVRQAQAELRTRIIAPSEKVAGCIASKILDIPTVGGCSSEPMSASGAL